MRGGVERERERERDGETDLEEMRKEGVKGGGERAREFESVCAMCVETRGNRREREGMHCKIVCVCEKRE